jgi:hypothetical protein
VNAAKIVIGLVTPSSLGSYYVMFELGARWGADLFLAPLLAGVKPRELSGPLSLLNALDATNEAQLHQFVENISGRLSLPLQSTASYLRSVAHVKGLAGGVPEAAARDSASALQKTIAERDTEIEKLKHRPYDEEHRRLAEGKVNGLREISKDLVWYLLHYGETETNDLMRRCKHAPEYLDAVQRARETGLVLDIRTGNPGQGTEKYSWKINPEFKVVLQDLLGGRKTTYF